jgi:phosphatidylserine decarboxylase
MFFFLLAGIVLAILTVTPLAWKWQLGVVRIVLLAVVTSLIAAVLTWLLARGVSLPTAVQTAITWILGVAGVFGFLAYRFYRDPERTIQSAPGVILSPADGKVIYIRRSQNGTLPVATKHGQDYPLRELTKMPFYTEEAIVIGISMNFMDVHVNRAPIAGRIAFQRHFPGQFGSLRHPEMVFENERATTVFESGKLQIAVVQIASRLVRQIASFVKEEQQVALGERFGVIRFGSQVDMVLPALDALKIAVEPGQLVKAGLSPIAHYTSASDLAQPETVEEQVNQPVIQ